MENPYPRRNELPTSERVLIAGIDNEKHAAIRNITELSEQAFRMFDAAQLYSEPTYLGNYVDELTPSDPGSVEAANALSDLAHDASADILNAETAREAALIGMTELTRGLFTPVRDFSDARKIKQGNLPGATGYDPAQPTVGDYREIVIDPSDEPMVTLVDYGINCRSYYSRPNGVTGEAVPGVKPDVFVRREIAEKLVVLNDLLKLPEVIEFFGGEVELFVDEGYRDPEIQAYLHSDFLPKLITKQLAKQNGIDLETATAEQLAELEKEMIPMRDKKSARPSKFGEGTPGPHQTGSAVDMTIRYKQDTTDLVPRVNIWFGKDPANLVKVNDPDHFEHTLPTNHEELVAQQNLRAWHYLLSLVGLKQNPTEFWHTGDGDQLSMVLEGDVDSVIARYGWPSENPQTYIPVEE